MSKSDNTLPWRLREEDRPELPWCQILNTQARPNRNGNINWKMRERRRWWHSERRRVKNELRMGIEPLETLPRHGIVWDMF